MADLTLLNKYPYIVAWGHLSNSMKYYVQDQCQKANVAKAPEDAVYYNDVLGRWILKSELKPDVQAKLDKLVSKKGATAK